LPYRDDDFPYEWQCNISFGGSSYNIQTISNGDAQPLGNVNKMIRARVYDESGQVWTDENWINIKTSIDSSNDVSISASSQGNQIPGSQQQGSTHIGSINMGYTLLRQLLGLR